MSGLNGQFNSRLQTLERMQKEGGSSLPSYSSSDIGKVLTVGEGSETVQTVIVPQQTVNFVEGTASLSNVAMTYDDLVVGDTATLHISDVAQSNEYEMTVTAETSGKGTFLYYLYTSGTEYYQIFNHQQNGWTIFAEGIEHTPLSGKYTVSLIASIPKAEPKWETPSAGGGALVIKATGEAKYSADDGYAVQADVDETTLNNCFLPDTAKPVYALFPAFSSIGGVTAYSYDNANGNYMMPLSKPQTSVKIGEYETYSVFKLSGHVYLGYKENSV